MALMEVEMIATTSSPKSEPKHLTGTLNESRQEN
jgi:hypothetical protein